MPYRLIIFCFVLFSSCCDDDLHDPDPMPDPIECKAFIRVCDEYRGHLVFSNYVISEYRQQLIFIEPLYSCSDQKLTSLIMTGAYDAVNSELHIELISGDIGDKHICFDEEAWVSNENGWIQITYRLGLCDGENEICGLPTVKTDTLRNLNLQGELLSVGVEFIQDQFIIEESCSLPDSCGQVVTPKVCDFNIVG